MSYTKPQKRILTKEELEEFQHSSAYEDFIGYIERLNESVKGIKIDSEVETSPVNDYPLATAHATIFSNHLLCSLLLKLSICLKL
jgi:hypothetical protein